MVRNKIKNATKIDKEPNGSRKVKYLRLFILYHQQLQKKILQKDFFDSICFSIIRNIFSRTNYQINIQKKKHYF